MKYPHMMLLEFMEQIPHDPDKDGPICLHHLKEMSGFSIHREDDDEMLVRVYTDDYVVHLDPISEGGISDKDTLYIEHKGQYHVFDRWLFGAGSHYEGARTSLPYWSHEEYWVTK